MLVPPCIFIKRFNGNLFQENTSAGRTTGTRTSAISTTGACCRVENAALLLVEGEGAPGAVWDGADVVAAALRVYHGATDPDIVSVAVNRDCRSTSTQAPVPLPPAPNVHEADMPPGSSPGKSGLSDGFTAIDASSSKVSVRIFGVN